MREEQVDKGDGDGREVLQDQTDQPVVLTLRNIFRGVRYEDLFTKSRTHCDKTRCSVSKSYLILCCFCGKVDKVEGSAQKRQHEKVEERPKHVETHLLSKCPLSHAPGEILLLQEQLRTSRQKNFTVTIFISLF